MAIMDMTFVSESIFLGSSPTILSEESDVDVAQRIILSATFWFHQYFGMLLDAVLI